MRRVRPVELPRTYLRGGDHAHHLTLGDLMVTIKLDTSAFDRAFDDMARQINDMFAVRRRYTRRERLRFRAWETWYALRAWLEL